MKLRTNGRPDLLANAYLEPPTMPTSCGAGFRFIDLFAGIGGFRRALETAGGRCVFTCEIDRFSRQTYAANFALGHPLAEDIRDVDAGDIPDFDILAAGFPCQPFSIAGVSKKRAIGQPVGFACQAQGTLFFDVARILAAHRPAAFILENVRNLVGHDGGRTFAVIRDTLCRDLGYHIQWRILDAGHWLPQHRERIFIVGFRDAGTANGGCGCLDELDPPAGPRPTLHAILHPEDGSEDAEEPYTTGRLGKVAPKYTLSQHLWDYLQAYARRHRARGNGFGYGLFDGGGVARTLSARYYKDGSEILVKQSGSRPRRLTPRECARLMGFDAAPPGDAAPRFVIPVSDTQAYRQFGNAVAVPVATAVARAVVDRLCAETVVRARSVTGSGAHRFA